MGRSPKLAGYFLAIFAKETEAEKLIIVAPVDGRMDTIYRGRAVLANMTATARMAWSFPGHHGAEGGDRARRGLGLQCAGLHHHSSRG